MLVSTANFKARITSPSVLIRESRYFLKILANILKFNGVGIATPLLTANNTQAVMGSLALGHYIPHSWEFIDTCELVDFLLHSYHLHHCKPVSLFILYHFILIRLFVLLYLILPVQKFLPIKSWIGSHWEQTHSFPAPNALIWH